MEGNTDLRILNFKSSDDMYDANIKVKIKGIRIPNLEEFQSYYVSRTELDLTQKITPKFHTTFIRNMPDEVKCKMKCPEFEKNV